MALFSHSEHESVGDGCRPTTAVLYVWKETNASITHFGFVKSFNTEVVNPMYHAIFILLFALFISRVPTHSVISHHTDHFWWNHRNKNYC